MFDEIEKADDAAFDLLLGVLGEGRLTDALGRLIDFRMSLIVMTTNLGAADPRPAGFSSDPDAAPDPIVRDQELLPSRAARSPRLGRRVPAAAAEPRSSASSISSSRSCARVPASSRATCASRSRPLRARVSPTLGHDPKLGARPLRRTIEDLVVAPLAERMAREPAWRDATVRIADAGETGEILI